MEGDRWSVGGGKGRGLILEFVMYGFLIVWNNVG